MKINTYNFCFLFSDELVVRAGSPNPRLIISVERNITHFKLHPSYDGTSFYYDVAVVFLDKVHQFILDSLIFLYYFLETWIFLLYQPNMSTRSWIQYCGSHGWAICDCARMVKCWVGVDRNRCQYQVMLLSYLNRG